MNKKLLTIAVAAAMAAPLAAQAADGPVVYGQVHAAIENVDFDADAADTDADNLDQGDYFRVVSRQSRLGVKGDEDLGGGLKAIYKLEFQIDIDDNSTDAGGGVAAGAAVDNITARDQYVGLAGSWGTFLLGRHDTPFKFMTISRDKFNTTLGDWNEVGFTANAAGAIAEDNRANNAILYISPSFNGFTAAGLVSPGESGGDDDGIADDTISLGAKYENGPMYLSAAWEEQEFQGDDVSGTNDDEERWRLAGSYQIGDFNVGGMYEDMENRAGVEGIDGDVWQLSASYTFGNNVAKVAYQDAEMDLSGSTDPEYDTWTLGLDHNLSKRTRAYAVYTKTDTNSDAQTASYGDDWDAFGLGLIHSF